MTEQGTSTNRVVVFFNDAALWKACLLVLSYLVLYVGVGSAVSTISGVQITSQQALLQTPHNILFGLTIPIAIGAFLLLLFGHYLGWTSALFGPQPQGRPWMWLAPVLVVTSVVLRLVSADYGAFPAASIVLLFLTGAWVGISEELITRGFAVKIIRDAGHSERTVMVMSSFLFGLMHATNILGGQSLSITLLQIAFTFGFGVCMFLILRVTGRLLYAIIIHGLYDPSLFIATGGINHVSTEEVPNPLASLAGSFTLLFLIFAVIAIFFVRDRVGRKHPIDG